MVASNNLRPFPGRTLNRAGLLLLLTGLVSVLLCLSLPARAEKRFYSLQVGAYRNINGAKKVVSELKKLGHRAFFRKENIKNKGRWFRVYIEKYPSKDEACKEGKVLKGLGLISEYAVRLVEVPGIDPSAQKGDGTAFYFLHVSSFREEAHAEGLTDSLIGQGQKAFHVAEMVAGEKWFRVYIGEFESEEEARNAGDVLREKGVIQSFKAIRIEKAASAPED